MDHLHDRQDREQGKRTQCPAMVLWSLRDDHERLYGDVLEVWRPWTTSVEGHGLDCGQHMAEEAPEALANALIDFLGR